jgi:alcohol dehydrogenase
VSAVGEEATRLEGHVVYGPGSVDELPRLVGELGARRVLLVCGRRSFEASGAAAVLPELEARAEVHRFSDYSPNTDVEDVHAGLAALRASDPDVVVAVGGGSAMDLAKLLCAFDGTSDITAAIEAGDRVTARRRALVLAPTTSGSGSEATHFAVVYVGQHKHSIAGPAMLPDRVILDPELSRTGSDQQRAASGIDAVCQAIESLWATGGTDESRDLARRALPLLLPSLSRFVEDPTPDLAAAMCLGSHLAGRAINISKTTAAHALSYGLTMRHGIAHGHAVALTLGAFIEAHAAAPATRLQPAVDPSLHQACMHAVLASLDAEDGAAARARFEALVVATGLETRLRPLGVETAEERRILAGSVNVERLGNNPVVFDEAALEAILLEVT